MIDAGFSGSMDEARRKQPVAIKSEARNPKKKSIEHPYLVDLGRGLVGALKAGVEVPGGELGGDGSDLEDELVPVGADPGDGPPAEEGPDADAVEARDAAVVEAAREAVAEGGEVAPRGQHDAAAGAEVDGEVPGAGVERVGPHVGREQAPREPPEAELVVRGGVGGRGQVGGGGGGGVLRAGQREQQRRREQEGEEAARHRWFSCTGQRPEGNGGETRRVGAAEQSGMGEPGR